MQRRAPEAPNGTRRALLGGMLAVPLLPRVASGWQDATTPPVIGTPSRVIERMFWLARLRSSDTVLDLGSGDGRIVLEAAGRYGARAIGIEMRPDLVEASRREAQRLGIDSRASFRAEDIFRVDLGEATVLTLYLSAEFNERLMPRILQTARPGARVVSHDFAMGIWRPDAAESFAVPEKHNGRGGESRVMMWVVPASVAGRWRATLGEGSIARTFEFSLTQQYQSIEGALRTERGHRRFVRESLRGAEIVFGIDAPPSPYPKGRVTARVEGERMTGTYRFDDGSVMGAPITAERIATRPEIFD